MPPEHGRRTAEPTHTLCVHGTLHTVFDTFPRNLLQWVGLRRQVMVVLPHKVTRCMSPAEASSFVPGVVAWIVRRHGSTILRLRNCRMQDSIAPI
jgi:hypothetical protein